MTNIENRLVLGVLVNPFAGIGGAVGLKGSDGQATREEALRRGATPMAVARMIRALQAVARQPPADRARLQRAARKIMMVRAFRARRRFEAGLFERGNRSLYNRAGGGVCTDMVASASRMSAGAAWRL